MPQFLPPEVLAHIISFLGSEGLATYAPVCKQWQAIVERQSFSTLHLTPDRLQDFRRIISSSRSRSSHVRHLDFYVTLPEYDQRAEFENDEDRARNNHAFTSAIQALLEAISGLSGADQHCISLTLYAQSPSDWRAEPDRKKRLQRHRWGRRFLNKDLLDWRYARSYLRLVTEPPHDIPAADAITELDIRGDDVYRKIAPESVSKIASRLPRLQRLDAKLFDNERKDQALRDGLRSGNLTVTPARRC